MTQNRSFAVKLTSAPAHIAASLSGALGRFLPLQYRRRTSSVSPAPSDEETGLTGAPAYEMTPKLATAVERPCASIHSDKTILGTIDAPGANVTPAKVSRKPYGLTKRGLKSRHAQMIALGGTLGTFFFESATNGLLSGGPVFLVAASVVVAMLGYLVLTAIVEMTAYLPVHGGTMNYFAYRYVSPSLGFAMGYMYWFALTMAAIWQITDAWVLVGSFWGLNLHVSGGGLTAIIIILIVLNSLPVRVFGEAEYWFTMLKIILLLVLLVVSVIIFCGGAPNQNGVFLGFHYWTKPSPLAEKPNRQLENRSLAQALRFLEILIVAYQPFQFAPELIVMVGGEMEKPRKNLQTAATLYFYRLIFFSILIVLGVSLITPREDLFFKRKAPGAWAGMVSPWFVAFKTAGIPALSSFLVVAVAIAAVSSANSYLYISSRSLYSLAVVGSAPRIFKRCSVDGVPYFAVMASLAFVPLAYMRLKPHSNNVLVWLDSGSKDLYLVSQICCCIIYIRFRKAVKAQQVTTMPFRSKLQPWGIWIALCSCSVLLVVYGFWAFWPWSFESPQQLFDAYGGLPIFGVLYIGHRLCHRKDKWARDPMEADLWTGMVEIEAAEASREDMEAWYEKEKKEI